MEQLGSLVPFALMFLVMYFLVLRPQAREKEEHDNLVAGLAKDDQVVLGSGLHGKVVAVRDATLVLELGKGVHVTVDKVAVVRKQVNPSAATTDGK
ncbi:MAG: preprotein translocase subunit YajC [Alphaproteobacteria bacterium]|nr:preprotein translocase subunit YajC [Alphaproteobacteria bacterium]